MEILITLKSRRNPESGEDELRACIKRSLCFEDFLEQPIQFDPTYKFQPNTQIYDLSRSLRCPSHTVRDTAFKQSTHSNPRIESCI